MLGRIVNLEGRVGITIRDAGDGQVDVQVLDGSPSIKVETRPAAELQTFRGESIVGDDAADADADDDGAEE